MSNRIRLASFVPFMILVLACSAESPDPESSATGVSSSDGTPSATTTVASTPPEAATEPTTTASAPETLEPRDPPAPQAPPLAPEPRPPTTPEAENAGGAGMDGPAGPAQPPAGGSGAVDGDGMGGTEAAAGMGGRTAVGGMSGGITGGTGGTDTAGGAGGNAMGEVNPSPGCGKSGRPDGGRIYASDESWLLFPEAYDGNTPMPVLFGFHGCGSGNRGDATRTEYLDATRNTPFESEYVVAVPISSDAGGCWNYNMDIARVRELYDDLTLNHCVDMNRVFATGHSSGAYFAVALLEADHAADAEHLNLRGMAPVAASPVRDHTTPMPVLYMENPNDSERNDDNAPTVVAGFRSANACAESTQPYDGAESCNSSSGGAMVDPGCVIYDDCTEPTVWCSHDDQSYGTTGHGIPCFAAQAMDSFFKSL